MLAFPDTSIRSAALAGSGTYCRVVGVIRSADGFEIWPPTSGRNGKLMGVGNGGFAGYINVFGMSVALARGYATASTDTGLVGSPLDASWALGRPDLVVDFGHRSIRTGGVVDRTRPLCPYPRVARYTGSVVAANFTCGRAGR